MKTRITFKATAVCLAVLMVIEMIFSISYIAFAEIDEVYPIDHVIVGDIDNGEKGVWTEYGYTKPDFDAFPGALREAMLNEPENIGVTFSVPTREELAESERRMQEINREAEFQDSTDSSSTERRNAVGTILMTGIVVLPLHIIFSLYDARKTNAEHSLLGRGAQSTKVSKGLRNNG